MELDNLARRFTYHTPTPESVTKFMEIRKQASALANLINGLCPENVEKEQSVVKLEEVVFWANASIARGVEDA